MTFMEYSQCLKAIGVVLKKKYTNLSVEETINLATEIMFVVINELDLKQE